MALLENPATVAVLRAFRADLNAQLARASRLDASFDGDSALLLFAELLSACEEAFGPSPAFADRPEAGRAAGALLRAGIALSGTKKGNEALVGALKKVLVGAPRVFISAPERFLDLTRQAASKVLGHSAAAADDWASLLASSSASLSSMDHFRLAGFVAAWRCGLTQYREAALEAVFALPANAEAALLGIAEDRVAGAVAALWKNEWLSPCEAAGQETPPPCVAFAVGGHELLGGPFDAFPDIREGASGLPLIVCGERAFGMLASREGVHLYAIPFPDRYEAARRDSFDADKLAAILQAGADRGSANKGEPARGDFGNGLEIAKKLLRSPMESVLVSRNSLLFSVRGSFMVCVLGFPGGFDALR